MPINKAANKAAAYKALPLISSLYQMGAIDEKKRTELVDLVIAGMKEKEKLSVLANELESLETDNNTKLACAITAGQLR